MAEITGTSDHDILDGTSSADTIVGGSGNDALNADLLKKNYGDELRLNSKQGINDVYRNSGYVI